ncbi:Glycosyl hydrolase family protein isoform 6 [Theobroma cacao]|uniref:Glycosyl hydrolase family protein isoform 6 n=1 Tax=Theobroma cacao TaxID=3641 RepID=A0A061GZX6_THECC|nr:Glycosyl hydrolase family protein isoform 6 [Theobroma cacao]
MDCVYKNPNAPIEDRVKDLLSRMTLQEKIGQMTQIERRVADPSALKDFSIGSILSAGGSGPFENALSSDWADMVDRFQQAALESRLGIPLIYGIDAVHGNNSVYGATIFPHNVGLGATRDADLAQRIGTATALEVRASGIQYTFAPCVTVKGYPFVAGRNNVIACAKHFVGDGGTEKGINEGNTILSYDDLERIHMAPYLDCISQGVSTIMASFSSWNGRKLHADHFLLTEILKDKLGFKELHRELAREAVRKSLVLLKNGKNPENPFLPLDKNAKRILVAGTHADDLGYQCGGWTGTWHGCSGRITIGTTILDAIREAVGDKTEVIYDQYPSPDSLAGKNFSFAIVVVGEPPYAETLGDNAELVIPFNGSDIISSVADKIPTLAILISGRPLVLEPWLLEKVDALVAAWFPGSEGGGVTDVVFGDFEFEGRLPMTWFRSINQLPMNAGHNSYDPLFPLGFGLTCNKEKSVE